MNLRQRRIVEQGVEALDPRREAAFEDRGEALAQGRVVAVARHEDEAGDEPAEGIAAREERHAVALLKAQNAGGEIEEIAIGGLEQLVARQGFENMRERLAVMARRFEAAAGQHGRD